MEILAKFCGLAAAVSLMLHERVVESSVAGDDDRHNYTRIDSMPYDAQAAANHASTHAVNSGAATGHCARAVREALAAGGVDVRAPHARNLGSSLAANGFDRIPAAGYSPRVGDVVVIQPYSGGSPSGHTALFNGQNWVSEFVQHDFWGGPGYRTNAPSHEFYRARAR